LQTICVESAAKPQPRCICVIVRLPDLPLSWWIHCLFRAAAEAENPTQPAMMTFKQFLSSQDDNITDEEAIKKFGDYKVEFRKQQINEFFVQHKDEEWYDTVVVS